VPELPDLLHIRNQLDARLRGRFVTSERVREPVVMRFAVHGNLSLVLGRPLREVGRRGAAILLRFEGLDLAVDPMLAGRFRFGEPGEKDPPSLAFALGFGDVELRYLDDKKMGKAYLFTSGDWGAIPALRAGGIDILSPEFTRERFVSLLRRRRDQVRVFLLDKKALDTIGNAYADEILFEAGLHPKSWCRSIDHAGALRLHDAIVSVMRAAIDEVARRDEPIDVKVRDFLKVRLKDVCPRCGSKLRTAGVKGMDAYFCPGCQPATRPGFVDWRKTGL
jgi:formamidopyrimidine-DNA glycosylase